MPLLVVCEEMKTQTYYEPLFKIWVSVLIETDPKKAKEKVQKLCDDDPLEDIGFQVDAKTIEYTTNSGGQRFVVWIRQKSAKHLAHELVHVIMMSFERRRILLDYHNDEVFAYLMEHLMHEFRRFY